MLSDFYVYQWTNNTNGKRYIGRGRRGRAMDHLTAAKRGKGRLLGSALRKYGAENFVLVYLEELLTNDEANQREMYYIASRKTQTPRGYNITIGGEGTAGIQISETHRRNLSLSHMGKKQSPEAVAKRVAPLRGQKRTPEQIARITAAIKAAKAANPITAETREKMRQAHLGKKHPHSPEHRQAIKEGHARSTKVRPPVSDATRAKLSAALRGKPKPKGRKASEETKAKMRAAHARRLGKEEAHETACD